MAETQKKPHKAYKESASRKKIRRALARGLTPRQISRKYGWARQNVYQHMQRMAERDRKVQEGEWFE